MERINGALEDLYQQQSLQQGGGEEARAHQILTDLGFPLGVRGRAVSSLSGGWRMRGIYLYIYVCVYYLLANHDMSGHEDCERNIECCSSSKYNGLGDIHYC